MEDYPFPLCEECRIGIDLKSLCIQVPKCYEECFRCFAEYPVAEHVNRTSIVIHNTVIWNNKFICIRGKSVFCEALFKKGIITLEHLTSEENDVIAVFQIMASASFIPKEKFQLMAIIDAIPTQWQNHLKTCDNNQNHSTSSTSAQLHLNGHICLAKLSRKNIYKEVRSKVEITPTTQL